MIFKCKMCGGELNIEKDNNICVCQYCKTKQTVPNISTEIEQQLFDRANYYRISNEFDKALPIYEQILTINPKESEAFWGIILCRYGVEYVEDPKTKERIPTCHKTCYESILNDLDYKSTLKHASNSAAIIYEKEAHYIDKVQKRIKEISSKEEPFDIFISYKESNGNDRTVDSVIAEEIYNNLTQKGYRVFFSRITLEDKLGLEYEPYIFSALNSAKIMLVVGTSRENLNSVWVKNEWNRYLSLINEGKEKVLIPCYKEMSPYEMPDEFATLQSQDMSKIGAIQDLLRGIDKIIKPSEDKITADKVDSYILKKSYDKAFEFIQQGKWDEAKKRLDNALDYDSTSAKIYLGYLLVDLKLHSLEELENYSKSYFNNKNYKITLKYANAELKELLEKYKQATQKRIIKSNKITLLISLVTITITIVVSLIIKLIIIPNKQYNYILELISNGDYKIAYDTLQTTLDLDNLAKDKIYTISKSYYDIKDFEKYEELYKYIAGYSDSDNMYKESKYITAIDNYNAGDTKNALLALSQAINLGHQKSEEKFEEIKKETYAKAIVEYNKTNYGTAKNLFEILKDYNYKDSNNKYTSCVNKIAAERKQYNGIWLENQNFWTNLKIDDSGIYTASNRDLARNEWNDHAIRDLKYDEDSATYSFSYAFEEEYIVTVKGNKLTLTCTSLKDKYDTDWWFNGYNKFTRQK